MKVTVERMSKFGFLANDVWYNPDKFSKPDFSSLQPGMEIEMEASGKYVKSFTILSQGAAPAQSSAKPTETKTGWTPKKEDPQVRLEIARGTAIKAAFGSAAMAETLKNVDVSEAVSTLKGLAMEMENYILTGDFKKQ